MRAMFVFICALVSSLAAAELVVPHQTFRFFGHLPEFTPGAGAAQDFRMPMAIDMGGRLPNLLLQSDSRLWFYINESKLGKVLFSEPILLMSTENQVVETTGAAVVQGNLLIIRRPDGVLQFASVVGEDVPMLQLGAEVREVTGQALHLAEACFLLKSGAMGMLELVTENGTYCGRKVDGELRFEAPVCTGGEFVLWIRSFYSPRDGQWKVANLQPEEKHDMNHAAVADFDGDGTPDMVLCGDGVTQPIVAIGIKDDSE